MWAEVLIVISHIQTINYFDAFLLMLFYNLSRSFLAIQCMSDYGDLIKKALGHIREHNPLKWYKTVLLTLQHEYTTLQDEGDGMVDHRSAEWADLKVITIGIFQSIVCTITATYIVHVHVSLLHSNIIVLPTVTICKTRNSQVKYVTKLNNLNTCTVHA